MTPELICTDYTYNIFLQNGTCVANNQSLTQFNGSLYYFNFTNQTGDYIVHLCDGRKRDFRVIETYDTKFQNEENARMYIATIVGILGIVAVLLFIAFKLDESHNILKLVLIFTSIALISLVPSVLIIDDYEVIFHKAIMYFTWIFWLYVGGYLVYWIIRKASSHVPK
jgi:hypothetical protein